MPLISINDKMKIHTSMPVKLKPYFQKELETADNYFAVNDFKACWHHIERAHILGQHYPYHHSLVHWKMLLFGIKIKNHKEIIAQIPRLVFGGIKSFVGNIPFGNTGGANVPPLKSLEIPKELKDIIEVNN